MQEIQNQILSNQESFGVEIIDIRIGRTDLTEQVSNNVYQRMCSEREKRLIFYERKKNCQKK